MIKTDFELTPAIEKSPLSFAEVPNDEPLTCTLAPTIGSPDSEVIFPVMVFDWVSCANTPG